MKINISSTANCLHWILYDLIQCILIRKREDKIDPCGSPKKTKQNKIRRCNSYNHFIPFLAEVINT